ncbi:MAG: MCE family protein [Cyanobacteria bacterium K_DeepCast_35m_m2_023]|nr:MCE family protein [Cyanobacteria bacterium K_DeepCast_35m_m2_023]
MSSKPLNQAELLSWRGHRRRLNGLNLESWVLLLGAATLLSIAVAGIGNPRNWWVRNLELTLNTHSAAGLIPGMPVKIAGYPVGMVKQVQLLDSGRVMVTLQVAASRAHLIGPRSFAALGQDNLLSKAYINIEADPRGGSRRAGQEGRPSQLSFRPTASIPLLLNELANSRLTLQQGIKGAAELVQRRLPRSLDQLDRTLQGGQQLTTTLERDLGGKASTISSELGSTTSTINQTLNQLQGTLLQVQALASSSNSLLQKLNRSWLIRLLEPAPATDQPAGEANRNPGGQP